MALAMPSPRLRRTSRAELSTPPLQRTSPFRLAAAALAPPQAAQPARPEPLAHAETPANDSVFELDKPMLDHADSYLAHDSAFKRGLVSIHFPVSRLQRHLFPLRRESRFTQIQSFPLSLNVLFFAKHENCRLFMTPTAAFSCIQG